MLRVAIRELWRRYHTYGLSGIFNWKFLRDGTLAYFNRGAQSVVASSTGDRILQRQDYRQAAEEIYHYREPEQFSLSYEGPLEVPDEWHPYLGEYEAFQPFICELCDVRLNDTVPGVDGDQSWVLEYRYAALTQSNRAPSFIRGLPSAVTDHKRRSPAREFDTVFALSAFPPPSYYHWLMEYAPKLQALEVYEQRTGRRPQVLVPPEAPSRLDTLTSLGLDPNQCIEWPSGPFHADRLVIPTHRKQVPNVGEYRCSLADRHWLRERASTTSDPPTGDFANRVFISRRDATNRRIVNHDHLLEALGQYGFESYTLSDFSFRETFGLFRQADVVVGPHGAGLVGTLFSESVTLIELIAPDHLSNGVAYFCLSCELDHNYDAVIASHTGGDNYYVRPEAVVASLRRMGVI